MLHFLLAIRCRFLVLLCAACLAPLALAADDPSSAPQERRVALVIGNSAYTGGGVLTNPVHDASDIAVSLKQLGFVVDLRTDADYKTMRRALTEFGRQVKEGTVALFFYAGHGMQVRGRNYLLPVDAHIQIENDVGTEAIDVDFLLDKLNQARLSMVILDACRNNPFERRFRSGSGAGLAHMAAPTGTLIAYSTAPGKVAADGEGRNGLYTGELLKAIKLPGLQIEDVFKHVRSSVLKLSDNAQMPWEASSLTGNFYFSSHPVAAADVPAPAPADTATKVATAVQPAAVPAVVPPAPAEPAVPVTVARGEAGDDEAWGQAQRTNTAAAYLAYIKAFPAGSHVGQARSIFERLRRAEARRELGKVFKDCDECPDMVTIPNGRFEMGSSHGGGAEQPVHDVSFARGYAIGRTEVTQGQWRAIMGSNPSRFAACGDNCPVENVSWDDVQLFLQRLNAKTGRQYRLPTEAEWEYAVRGGTTSHYAWGDEVGRNQANCDGCGSQWDYRSTAPVASFPPNGFGLYDMHGNVAEWIADCWSEDYAGAPNDGSALEYDGCGERVVRGGSWGEPPRSARSAARHWGTRGKRVDTRGFRLALTL